MQAIKRIRRALAWSMPCFLAGAFNTLNAAANAEAHPTVAYAAGVVAIVGGLVGLVILVGELVFAAPSSGRARPVR